MFKTLLDKGKGIVTKGTIRGIATGGNKNGFPHNKNDKRVILLDFLGHAATQYVKTPGVLFNKNDLFEKSIHQAALYEYLIRQKHRFIEMILDYIYYNRNGHYSLEN